MPELNLRIFSRNYRLAVTPGEEPVLEQCAQRVDQHMEAIRSGDPRQWVRIIKTSYLRGQERIAQGKKAAMIDERYFHAAEEQLYEELSIALNLPKEDMRAYIGRHVAE